MIQLLFIFPTRYSRFVQSLLGLHVTHIDSYADTFPLNTLNEVCFHVQNLAYIERFGRILSLYLSYWCDIYEELSNSNVRLPFQFRLWPLFRNRNWGQTAVNPARCSLRCSASVKVIITR